MVQSTWLTTHPTLGPIGMAHIVGLWVHLRAQVQKIGSPDFRFYVAWVHGLVGNYCRKTPQSKPGQCRGSMVQSTWLTTHPTLGPIGMGDVWSTMLIGPWNPYTDRVWTGVFFYNNCPPVHGPMPHEIENPASQFFCTCARKCTHDPTMRAIPMGPSVGCVINHVDWTMEPLH